MLSPRTLREKIAAIRKEAARAENGAFRRTLEDIANQFERLAGTVETAERRRSISGGVAPRPAVDPADPPPKAAAR